jgi:hypothetical protein
MRNLLRNRYVGMCLACLATLAFSNWLGEVTGYRFWQPTINSNAERIFAFERHVEHADVVFLGSSRTDRGINAPEMQVVLSEALGEPVSAYSFGVPNACMLESASFTENILVGKKTPKLVVAAVSVQDLYVNPDAAVTHFRYYATQTEILRLLPMIRTEREFEAVMYGLCRGLSSFELALVEAPFLPKLDARVQQALAQRGSYWRDTASEKGARFADRDDQRAVLDKAIWRQSGQIEGAYFDGPGVEALRRLVADTRARGIRLLLVENPQLPEYYQGWYSTTPAYEAYKAFLREFTAKEGIPLFDKTAVELGLDARDFHDPDHMHPDGALKFTRILATEAIAPLLAARP